MVRITPPEHIKARPFDLLGPLQTTRSQNMQVHRCALQKVHLQPEAPLFQACTLEYILVAETGCRFAADPAAAGLDKVRICSQCTKGGIDRPQGERCNRDQSLSS